MIVQFDKEYLKELFENAKCTNKKYRFQPRVVKAYIRQVMLLAETKSPEDLYKINSLNYEVLSGDKKGVSSIRVDRKYRLEFMVSKEFDSEIIINICTLTELSNHYK
ncbi:MAG: type II toxin-antitoxin system RelE/ParE family toxin [Rikenellaceae bacterium]